MSSLQKFPINLRLPCNFVEVSEEIKGLYDCILQLGDTSIPCNRILLARNSEWFDEYFANHPKPEAKFHERNVVIVPINDIIPNYMQEFINIFYKTYLTINVNNLPHLLKIAYFYKFPHISKILRAFYKDASKSDSTLMHFAKTFIQNGLIDDAKALAPMITTHFINAENNDPNEQITINDIYDALSPPIFASVLIERRKRLEKELSMKLTENGQNQQQQQPNQDQKYTVNSVNEDIKEKMNNYILNKNPTGDRLLFKYIEDFVKVKGVNSLTKEDKDNLAEVFVSSNTPNGLEENVFKNDFIKYNCDWAPSKYLRYHIARRGGILDSKITALTKFQKAINKLDANDTTSRWYVLNRIRNIHLALRDESVPLIEFIRTYGGYINPIDPVEYGFIRVDSSKPIHLNRKAENALIQDPSRYFMSSAELDDNGNPFKLPYIRINLCQNALFSPLKLFFDSRSSYKSYDLNKENAPKDSLKMDNRSHVSRAIVMLNEQDEMDRKVKEKEMEKAEADRDKQVLFDIPYKSIGFNILPYPQNPGEIDFPGKNTPFTSAKFAMVENDKASDSFRLTTLEIVGDFVLKYNQKK